MIVASLMITDHQDAVTSSSLLGASTGNFWEEEEDNSASNRIIRHLGQKEYVNVIVMCPTYRNIQPTFSFCPM